MLRSKLSSSDGVEYFENLTGKNPASIPKGIGEGGNPYSKDFSGREWVDRGKGQVIGQGGFSWIVGAFDRVYNSNLREGSPLNPSYGGMAGEIQAAVEEKKARRKEVWDLLNKVPWVDDWQFPPDWFPFENYQTEDCGAMIGCQDAECRDQWLGDVFFDFPAFGGSVVTSNGTGVSSNVDGSIPASDALGPGDLDSLS